MDYLYELEEITKTYGKKPSLTNLNLNIEEGITAIIGYSGAGKTTFLRILAGLEMPTSGVICFKGTKITQKKAKKLRQEVTMLFQDPIFFNQSVEDNVTYGLRRRNVKKNEAYKRAKYILSTLGLDGFEKRKAINLSGGEQKRVALARAIITEPKVLLLDEPTTDLDPENSQVIIRLIKEFSKTGSVIVATHDFRQVIELARRIVVLIDGELIQYDSPQKIFYEPSSEQVARFVGIDNIFHGKVVSNEEGVATVRIGQHEIRVSSKINRGEVKVYVRPENVILSSYLLKSSARNNMQGQIKSIKQIGPVFKITLDNGLSALITKQSLEELELSIDKRVFAVFKATAVHLTAK
jgi:tungstate transport system ATP-binding protein